MFLAYIILIDIALIVCDVPNVPEAKGPASKILAIEPVGEEPVLISNILQGKKLEVGAVLASDNVPIKAPKELEHAQKVNEVPEPKIGEVHGAPNAKVNEIKDDPKAKVDEIKEDPKAKVDEIKEDPKAKVDEIKEDPKAKVEKIQDNFKPKDDETRDKDIKVIPVGGKDTDGFKLLDNEIMKILNGPDVLKVQINEKEVKHVESMPIVYRFKFWVLNRFPVKNEDVQSAGYLDQVDEFVETIDVDTLRMVSNILTFVFAVIFFMTGIKLCMLLSQRRSSRTRVYHLDSDELLLDDDEAYIKKSQKF